MSDFFEKRMILLTLYLIIAQCAEEVSTELTLDDHLREYRREAQEIFGNDDEYARKYYYVNEDKDFNVPGFLFVSKDIKCRNVDAEREAKFKEVVARFLPHVLAADIQESVNHIKVLDANLHNCKTKVDKLRASNHAKLSKGRLELENLKRDNNNAEYDIALETQKRSSLAKVTWARQSAMDNLKGSFIDEHPQLLLELDELSAENGALAHDVAELQRQVGAIRLPQVGGRADTYLRKILGHKQARIILLQKELDAIRTFIAEFERDNVQEISLAVHQMIKDYHRKVLAIDRDVEFLKLLKNLNASLEEMLSQTEDTSKDELVESMQRLHVLVNERNKL